MTSSLRSGASSATPFFCALRYLRREILQNPCLTHTEKGGTYFVGVYLGAKRSYPREVKSILQSDEETAYLFFCGGTHRSTVFLFDQKNRKHESGFHGDDSADAAVLFPRHVRERRHAAGSALAAFHRGKIRAAESAAIQNGQLLFRIDADDRSAQGGE